MGGGRGFAFFCKFFLWYLHKHTAVWGQVVKQHTCSSTELTASMSHSEQLLECEVSVKHIYRGTGHRDGLKPSSLLHHFAFVF